jgi:hypothetical protein
VPTLAATPIGFVPWPSMTKFEATSKVGDITQLLNWYLRCPKPQTPEEYAVEVRLTPTLCGLRDADIAARRNQE